MAVEAQCTQLQFDGMEDPAYIDLGKDLEEYFEGAKLGPRPEGDSSIAETFLWVGGRTYELFLTKDRFVYEVYGPGLYDDLYVTDLCSDDRETAKGIAMAILGYCSGSVEPGSVYSLAA